MGKLGMYNRYPCRSSFLAMGDYSRDVYKRQPVTSARVNLENLFANVPRFLKNASDFKMQSFEYVGKAKSRRSIRRLIKKSYQDVRAWEIKTEISKRNDTLTQVNIIMKRDPWQLKADTVTDVYKRQSQVISCILFLLWGIE